MWTAENVGDGDYNGFYFLAYYLFHSIQKIFKKYYPIFYTRSPKNIFRQST